MFSDFIEYIIGCCRRRNHCNMAVLDLRPKLFQRQDTATFMELVDRTNSHEGPANVKENRVLDRRWSDRGMTDDLERLPVGQIQSHSPSSSEYSLDNRLTMTYIRSISNRSEPEEFIYRMLRTENNENEQLDFRSKSEGNLELKEANVEVNKKKEISATNNNKILNNKSSESLRNENDNTACIESVVELNTNIVTEHEVSNSMENGAVKPSGNLNSDGNSNGSVEIDPTNNEDTKINEDTVNSEETMGNGASNWEDTPNPNTNGKENENIENSDITEEDEDDDDDDDEEDDDHLYNENYVGNDRNNREERENYYKSLFYKFLNIHNLRSKEDVEEESREWEEFNESNNTKNKDVTFEQSMNSKSMDIHTYIPKTVFEDDYIYKGSNL